jgi:hypothetical protein
MRDNRSEWSPDQKAAYRRAAEALADFHSILREAEWTDGTDRVWAAEAILDGLREEANAR